MSIKGFEVYLKGRGRSETTIIRYLQVVNQFIVHVGRKKKYGRNDVYSYMASLRDMNVSKNYQRFVLYPIKDFFRYLEISWPLDSSDIPKSEEPKRPFFNLGEIQKILGYVDSSDLPLRDVCVFHVGAEIGPRRMELSEFNRDDVSFKDGQEEDCHAIYVRPGKRNKPGWRPLSPVTLRLLKKYLEGRSDDSDALFYSPQGGRLVPASFSYMFQQVVSRALPGKDLQGYGWHCFRRGLVTILRRRPGKEGLTTKETQELFGWLTPTMPMIYEQLEDGEVQAHARRIHPLMKKDEEEEAGDDKDRT